MNLNKSNISMLLYNLLNYNKKKQNEKNNINNFFN